LFRIFHCSYCVIIVTQRLNKSQRKEIELTHFTWTTSAIKLTVSLA